MAKKVTITVLSLLIVAGAIVGVTLYTNNDDNTTATEPTQQISNVAVDVEDATDAPTDSTDTTQTESVAENETVANDGSNTDDITTTDFTIEKVVDHTTGEQVPPRVVFGLGFSRDDNYIKFSSDGTFEMYLSGFLSQTTKGIFVEHEDPVYDDYIYVEFEDGRSYEYEVEYDDNGNISYIIVPYGDYSIYFS